MRLTRFGRRRHDFFRVHAETFGNVAPGVVDFALAEDGLNVFARGGCDFAGNHDVARLIAVFEQTFDGAHVDARIFREHFGHLLTVEFINLFAGDAEFFGHLTPIGFHGKHVRETFAADFGQNRSVLHVFDVHTASQGRFDLCAVDAVLFAEMSCPTVDVFGNVMFFFFGVPLRQFGRLSKNLRTRQQQRRTQDRRQKFFLEVGHKVSPSESKLFKPRQSINQRVALVFNP